MIDPSNPDFKNTPASDRRPSFDYSSPPGPPLFSIVTPYWNASEVFLETVRSVRRQSLPRFEWIVVDDGSTDAASIERLAAAARADPRLRIVRTGNRGPAAARNVGFREASCPWVMILDADDLVEPTFAEKAILALEARPEAAFCNSWSVGFGVQEYVWERGFERGRDFLRQNQVFPLVMIRRAAHRAVGGFDDSCREGHEDWDYWLNFASAGRWGITIPGEYLGWYRRNPDSRIMETLGSAERSERFLGWLRSKHAPLFDGGPFPSYPGADDREFAAIPDDFELDHRLADRPMAVLLLAPWLCMGGADRFNLDLTRLLCEAGIPVTIATTLQGRDEWQHRFLACTPDVFLLHHCFPLAHFPRALSYLIRSRRITHVVIASSWIGYDLLPYLRQRHPDVTVVDYLHVVEEYWRNGGYPVQSLGWQEHLDLTIVSSRHLKGWMEARGARPERVEVCTTNVDVREWDPARHDRGEERAALELEDPGTAVLAYVARLVEQKRPMVLLEILAELARSGRSFVALVIGDGHLEEPMRREARRLGLESRVRFLGARGQDEVRRLLCASDAFVLPSLVEGISIGTYEAMAMGVPVVVSDVGGQSELVTEECGFVVPAGEGEVARHVEALQALIDDPARRRRMGEAGRRRVQARFTLESMRDRMLELLRNARTNPRPSPGAAPATTLHAARLAVDAARMQRECALHWSEHAARWSDRAQWIGPVLALFEACRKARVWRAPGALRQLRRHAGELAAALGRKDLHGDRLLEEALEIARRLRKLRFPQGILRYALLRKRIKRCRKELLQVA